MSDAPFTGYHPLSLEALFALNLPEVTYLVDGILPQGAAALLSAREKAGKGLLAIDLCAAVALGEPFLDRAVTEGLVIYGAAEEHVRDVRARIRARVGHRRDAPLLTLPLDGSTGERLRLDDPASLQGLHDLILEYDPLLIVLDTFREFHDRAEDKSDEMGPLLRPLRQLAHETGTTILMNHHMNKGGAFRGSTAIRAAFDLEWAFSRTDDAAAEHPPAGTLVVEGRHGPKQVVAIALGSDMRWVVDRGTPPVTEPGVRERLLAYLETTNAWLTAHELAEGTKVALKTVQNTLSAMGRETPRPFATDGAGTKNDPRCFRVLAPRMDGFGDQDDDDLVPPDPGSLGKRPGGNHPGPPGDAGNDRWTR